MRAAIYARISNDPTGRAAGVQRQQIDCRGLVERNGWELVEVFVDNDVSATTGRRPAFEAMIDRVERGDFDVIVTWHLDRLYRRPRELEHLIELVEGGALGGGIRTVTAGDVDLNTASGRLVTRMLVDVSKHEVERTQERLVAMNRHAAAQGRRVGGRRAFGYETTGEIRELEAAVYRELVDRVLNGEALRSLVLELNGRGVLTAAAKPWSMRALRDVLRNPRYAGKRTYRGTVVADADWPPLVDPAQHRRLVSLLNDPARRSSPGPARRRYLAGIARCGECGTPLRSMRAGGSSAYGCPPTTGGGCGGVRVVADPLEELVRAAVFDVLADHRVADALGAALADEESTAVLAALADVDQRLTAIADVFASGEIDRGQMVRATEALRARRDVLQRKVRPSFPPLAIAAPAIAAERWGTDVDFRHDLTAAMFEVIVNRAPVPGRNVFAPDRVELRPL